MIAEARRSHGRLVAPDTVEVDGRRHRATRAVVIATGTTAAISPIPGLPATPYWTTRLTARLQGTSGTREPARASPRCPVPTGWRWDSYRSPYEPAEQVVRQWLEIWL